MASLSSLSHYTSHEVVWEEAEVISVIAETEKGKKIVYVHPYKREDGTRAPAHERSTS